MPPPSSIARCGYLRRSCGKGENSRAFVIYSTAIHHQVEGGSRGIKKIRRSQIVGSRHTYRRRRRSLPDKSQSGFAVLSYRSECEVQGGSIRSHVLRRRRFSVEGFAEAKETRRWVYAAAE